MAKVKICFLPCNPSDNHWILVVLIIDKAELLILDPMFNGWEISNRNQKFCHDIGLRLFSQKFRIRKVNVISPNHVLQKDSKNYGVFCCFYGKHLIDGNNVFAFLLSILYINFFLDSQQFLKN